MAEKISRFDFYKNNDTDSIWWVDDTESMGEFRFSFDKRTVYSIFADYPHNLTVRQRELFDEENPYWAEFFKDRRR